MYQTLLKPALVDIKDFVLDTLFPITCLSCGSEGELICADCKISLSKLEHQRCIICQKQTPFGQTHVYCQTPHGADGLISFYDYHDEKMAKIIIAGKYKFIPSTYEVLGTMVSEKLKTDYNYLLQTTNYKLVPIPLHSTRKRWRGFNQAEILCKAIGKELGLETVELLERNKMTKTQKDLKRDKRLKNMQDAFKIKKDATISGKNIILIDDVTTTGATLQQAAKILKQHGANKVICLTVSRD